MWREQWERVLRHYDLFRERRRPGWRDQWARVQRWYGRFRKTNDGRPHERESDFYQDEVYAFFQNCHHLRDWLINDSASGLVEADLEVFVKSSDNLKLCGDLANGSKHLQLKTTWTGDKTTAFGRRMFRVHLGGTAAPIIGAQYTVESGGRTYDAFEVATACIAEWEAYLKGKRLL